MIKFFFFFAALVWLSSVQYITWQVFKCYEQITQGSPPISSSVHRQSNKLLLLKLDKEIELEKEIKREAKKEKTHVG